jgi:acyl-CoA synthetase (NDP forming)
VVAYKLGRSDLGRTLAATHSGAMTGDAQVADAFFEAHGIARVAQFETLLEALPLLRAGAAPRSGRVSVMTTTGGGAATVVDRLGEAGVVTVPASDGTADMLAAQGIDVAGKAITDLTLAGARREVFKATLEGMLADPRSDAVVVVVGSSGQFHPHITVEPIVECLRPDRPLAVYIVPDAPQSLRLLADAGVAAFRTPEACADAIRTLLCWRPPRSLPSGCADAAVLLPALREAALRADRDGGLSEAQCYPVFEALGIPVAPYRVIDGAAEAAPVSAEVPFPVVLKLLSGSITHKSDVGGVQVGIADEAALQQALTAMAGEVRARGLRGRVQGYLVQGMRSGLAEAVVAYRRDAEVGPLVSVGLGGRFTEIYADIAVRVAPVHLDEALAMIDEVRGLAVLRGYRGMPAGDVQALARAVCALSRLALVPEVCVNEAEINPLIVGAVGEGAVAVDGVMTLAPEA